MPFVAENRSSKWDACRTKATHLEYCLRDNNYRPIDCVPEILDLKECCQIHEAYLLPPIQSLATDMSRALYVAI